LMLPTVIVSAFRTTASGLRRLSLTNYVSHYLKG
jgi:hypothetical protein